MEDIDFQYKTELLKYTSEDVDIILATYGRNRQSVKEDVKVIKDWLNSQPHLPHPHPSERQLVSSLIRNKCSIEKTKAKIDASYTIKLLIPEFYKDIIPTDTNLLIILDSYQLVPLPKLTPDLNRVILCHLSEDCPDLNAINCLTMGMCLLEMKMLLDISLNDIVVFDWQLAPMGFFLKFGPMELKKALAVFEKVYSNRFKSAHIVNVTPFAMKFVEICKALLPKKLKDRIYIHVDYESLFKVLPREIFPKDFGGKEKTLTALTEEWKALYKEYTDHFKMLQDLVVDETFRPKNLENDEYLGYHGNFRKLRVD